MSQHTPNGFASAHTEHLVVSVVSAGDHDLAERIRALLESEAAIQLTDVDARDAFADSLIHADAVVAAWNGETPLVRHIAAVTRVAPEIPVVVVAPRHEPRLYVAAARAGAQDCLAAPSLSGADIVRAVVLATERHRLARALRIAAETDELTGLLNRRGYRTAAEELMQLHDSRSLCQLFIDLDDLKAINDTRGHDAGDRAIVDVAAVLARVLGDRAVVARVGGDEFAALVVLDAGETPDDAIARTRRALAAASRGARFPVSASVGVARPAHEGHSVEELLANADQAMYAAKRARKQRRLGGIPTPSVSTAWTPARERGLTPPSRA